MCKNGQCEMDSDDCDDGVKHSSTLCPVKNSGGLLEKEDGQFAVMSGDSGESEELGDSGEDIEHELDTFDEWDKLGDQADDQAGSAQRPRGASTASATRRRRGGRRRRRRSSVVTHQ